MNKSLILIVGNEFMLADEIWYGALGLTFQPI